MARKRLGEPDEALFVRLPTSAMAALDRTADILGMPKKDLIAGLIAKHVDPNNKRSLNALGTASQPKREPIARIESSPRVVPGTYSFQPYEMPEVLSAEQAAQLLQVELALVLQLAEAGELPGRKLGDAWRFSKAALVAWVAGSSTR